MHAVACHMFQLSTAAAFTVSGVLMCIHLNTSGFFFLSVCVWVCWFIVVHILYTPLCFTYAYVCIPTYCTCWSYLYVCFCINVCVRSTGCNSLRLRAEAPGRESCGSGRSQQGSKAALQLSLALLSSAPLVVAGPSPCHTEEVLKRTPYWETSSVKTGQCHHVLLLAATFITPQ